jgi:dihydroorotate dehydrogenase (NAD+) catalytic subunit
VTRRFDDSPIDGIEINISCPNVKEGGVQFGNDPEMSARVVAACRAQTTKPIFTKLSPNQTDIRDNARLCIEAGTDGFSVINTVTGMAIDAESRRPVIGNLRGGLSGPAIKPIALLKVHEVHEGLQENKRGHRRLPGTPRLCLRRRPRRHPAVVGAVLEPRSRAGARSCM